MIHSSSERQNSFDWSANGLLTSSYWYVMDEGGRGGGGGLRSWMQAVGSWWRQNA